MSTRPPQSSAFTGEVSTSPRPGVLEWLFVFGSALALMVGFFLTLSDILTAFAVVGGSLAIFLAAMISTVLSLHFPQHARALEWLGCLGCAITWLNVVFYFARGTTTIGSMVGWALGLTVSFVLVGFFGFFLNILPLVGSSLDEERAKTLREFFIVLYIPSTIVDTAAILGARVVLQLMDIHLALTPIVLGLIALWGLQVGTIVHVYLPRTLRARLYRALWAGWEEEHVGPLIRSVGKGLLFYVLPVGTLLEGLRGNWALWLGSLGLLGIPLGLNWVTAWAGVFKGKRPSPDVEDAKPVEIPDLVSDMRFLLVNSLAVTVGLALLVVLAGLLQR